MNQSDNEIGKTMTDETFIILDTLTGETFEYETMPNDEYYGAHPEDQILDALGLREDGGTSWGEVLDAQAAAVALLVGNMDRARWALADLDMRLA